MTSGRMLGPALGALLALAVAPSIHGEPAARRDSYVLARGDHFSISGGTIEELKTARRRYSGDFLWAVRGGRGYLARDPEFLAEAFACFDGLKETEPQRQALEERRRDLESERNALEHEREALERQSDAAEASEDSEAATPASDESRRELDAKDRRLDARERDLDSRERELDAAEAKIDRRNDELERAAEARLWGLIDRAIANGIVRPTSGDRP